MGSQKKGPSGPFSSTLDSAFGSAGAGGAYVGDANFQRLTQTELNVTVGPGGLAVLIASLQQTPSGVDPIAVAVTYQRTDVAVPVWVTTPAIGTDENLQGVNYVLSGLPAGDYTVALAAQSDTDWDLDQFNLLALTSG